MLLAIWLILLAPGLIALAAPLATRTPRQLLITSMILLTAILGLWDWGARDLEHDTGGPGFGAAFLYISAGLALGAAAAGVILRLTIFGLQKRKPDWDVGHAWWFILLIPLAFAPQVFTRLLNH